MLDTTKRDSALKRIAARLVDLVDAAETDWEVARLNEEREALQEAVEALKAKPQSS
jgi:hypothetical protein